MGMSTMIFLWIYIFSLFFLQHQKNPNRKGEMMVAIKNQPCCDLSHTNLHRYDYQTSSLSLCLKQTSVIPKHMLSTVLIQNLHVAWIGLAVGTKVLVLLVSYSSSKSQPRKQTGPTSNPNFWFWSPKSLIITSMMGTWSIFGVLISITVFS